MFELLKGRKIIIYGAGKIGKILYKSLTQLGFTVDQFWDEYDIEIDGVIINKPNVLSIPKVERNDYIFLITIFAENISEEISNKLLKFGYIVVYSKKIINEIIYEACKKEFVFDVETCHTCPVLRNDCDIFCNHIIKDLPKENLIIHNMGVLISNKCNLSCQGCNHLRYLYKKKDNMDLTSEEIINDLTKIVDASDLICRLVIVGGEAFLHSEFYRILKDILELPKIGIINVITNGTVMPKNKEVFKLLSNKRVIVEISDYGDRLSEKLRDNMREFMVELDKNNVNYLCMNTLQWYDFGGFYRRSYSEEKHNYIYKTCCFVSNDLFKGRLYKCSRSTFGTLLGKIPIYPQDYVATRTVSYTHLTLPTILLV